MPTDATTLTHVLLVEDNPGDAMLIEEMLSEVRTMDFRCHFADRLSAALEQLRSESVDVLLLDLFLPDSAGPDTLTKLLAQEPALPIVVLSGLDDELLAIKAVQQGAQDYLVKGQVTSHLLARSLRYAIERNRAEGQLQLLAATLENNNRELHVLYAKVSVLEQLKTDMIRMASHDLLAMVSVFEGYLALLRPDIWDTLSNDQRDFFQQLESTSERMERLTRDILSLDRIEAAASNQLNRLDLRELVEMVFGQLQEQAKQKALRYHLDMSPTALNVTGDAPQLREALTNLINNAIKYTPVEGAVEVRLKQDGNCALFEVQDTGYGIPQPMQENLFQAFFRAKTKQTSAIGGTGLGLYLVKRVIERHQGSLHFHSVQGEGSLFGFRLPLALPDDIRP